MSEGSNAPAWGGNPSSIANPRRRKFLMGTVMGLGSVGVGFAAYPFLRSWVPNAQAKALGGPVKVDISGLQEDTLLIAEWRSKPIFIIKHSEAGLKTLDQKLDRLADPESKVDQQPAWAANTYRSLKPGISILIGLCTHLGCAPKFVPSVSPQAFDSNWLGGFFCPCHGSRFDLVGRVYKSVPAPTNLEVPPYKFEDENTVIIGVEA